jgi:tRNA nucleotidyltransferase (CCA-adding enzyme)
MNVVPQDINAYIVQRLESTLAPEVRHLLGRAVRIAAQHGWEIYVVGGYLRDLLLSIPDYDIDLSVVGDAPMLARLLAEGADAEVEVHERFGTATLRLRGVHERLDFVTARREWYPVPGALPSVQPGSIYDDLARRDFTVNAMAFALTPPPPAQSGIAGGSLIDPHGGLADLRQALIRVLHDRSFRDDPTRILRAVRLARRLDFAIEEHTLQLLEQAVREGALRTVSVDRLTHELLMVMKEPQAYAMLAELERLGVLRAIHPELHWPYARHEKVISDEVDQTLTPEQRQSAYLAVIGSLHPPARAEQLARFLRLPAPQIRLMRDAAKLVKLLPQLAVPHLKPSQAYALLKGVDASALEAYTRISLPLPGGEQARRWLESYLRELRHTKPTITGHHLRSLGIAPGPVYRRLLDDLLAAKLDGELPTEEEERAFIQEWLARERIRADL